MIHQQKKKTRIQTVWKLQNKTFWLFTVSKRRKQTQKPRPEFPIDSRGSAQVEVMVIRMSPEQSSQQLLWGKGAVRRQMCTPVTALLNLRHKQLHHYL